MNSCRECAACLAGEEQDCSNGNVGTYASVDRDGTITQGGYSTHVVVDEDLVLRVPESIRSLRARPRRRPAHGWRARQWSDKDAAHDKLQTLVTTSQHHQQ